MALVSFPCKSSVQVDLKTPVAKFIDHNYGSQPKANPALSKLEEMRSLTLTKLAHHSLDAAEQVAVYHDTLLTLEPRVPMTETDARIDWKWTDFSGKLKKLCTSAYERANLIYCFGAIHSQVAEASFTKDLKQSIVSLKLSVAALEYLISNFRMFGSTVSESTVPVLTALSSVMQAQAQECMFARAEQTSMKPEIIAQLACQCHQLFEVAHARCIASNVKHDLPKDWINNVSMKVTLYEALTQYYQSKVCEITHAGGERVARLTLAYSQMKKIKSHSSFNRQTMLEEMKRELEKATRENQVVYNQTIPQPSALQPVQPTMGFKKSDLPIPLAGDKAPDLFSFLVPLAVRETLNQAETVYRSLVSVELHRVRDLTSALNAVMVSLNLPVAIQLHTQSDPMEPVLEQAEAVRKLGGCAALREKVFSLPDCAKCCRDILNQELSSLDREEQSDSELKTRFGDKWTRQPSRKLNEQFRLQIKKMLDFLSQAKNTDKLLTDRFENNREMFELLSKPNLELTAALKSNGSSGASSPTPGGEQSKQALAQVCSQIETLKVDRQSLSDQLEALKLSDSSVNRLLDMHKTKKITEQDLLDLANSELEGPRACVRASEQKQEELLAELQSKYQACFGSSPCQESNNLRSRLITASHEFLKLREDLEEGVKFYSQLTAECLKAQDKINDFCVARETEKKEHLADITNSLSQIRLDDPIPAPAATTTVNAPPRPPPTYSSQPAVPATAAASAPTFMPAPEFPSAPPYGPLTDQSNPPGYGWQPAPYGPMGGVPPYPVYGFSPYMPPTGAAMYPYYPMMPGQPIAHQWRPMGGQQQQQQQHQTPPG